MSPFHHDRRMGVGGLRDTGHRAGAKDLQQWKASHRTPETTRYEWSDRTSIINSTAVARLLLVPGCIEHYRLCRLANITIIASYLALSCQRCPRRAVDKSIRQVTSDARLAYNYPMGQRGVSSAQPGPSRVDEMVSKEKRSAWKN